MAMSNVDSNEVRIMKLFLLGFLPSAFEILFNGKTLKDHRHKIEKYRSILYIMIYIINYLQIEKDYVWIQLGVLSFLKKMSIQEKLSLSVKALLYLSPL